MSGAGASLQSLSSSDLFQVEFEVFGKVQRVFFRKYTKLKADELSLTGWCVNTPEGTVKGVVCGSMEALRSFKQWASKEGSPQSQIQKAVFSPEERIFASRWSYFAVDKSYGHAPKKRAP
mmetsp:Transcript_72343/g.192864  ORF Transcript_72343/g.192864 Transcript_72343/m.192864 type:complete len:120 (-) Transcript_72343:23-382(-)